MNSRAINIRIYISLSIFLIILAAIDEGNIYLPMTSNFTIQHSERKINNKNYYTIPLKVGTPEKEFNVQVDTSTSTLDPFS